MPYFPPSYELSFEAVRSSGPGGQNVNKTNSAAILRWNVFASSCPEETKQRIVGQLNGQLTNDGDLIIRSQESRDLEMNKKQCIEKLKQILTKALFVPRPRRATKPTRGSKERRLKSKKILGERKSSRQKKWSN